MKKKEQPKKKMPDKKGEIKSLINIKRKFQREFF
jgi:hypothetical protein